MAQDRPKTGLKWHKIGPRRPKTDPKEPKTAPRLAPDVPKQAQDKPKMAKMVPRWPQNVSERGLRRRKRSQGGAGEKPEEAGKEPRMNQEVS